MASINVELHPAPSTPLNLQMGIVYAPRVETPGFVGYSCVEVTPNVFDVSGYDAHGGGAVLARYSSVAEAWYRLAVHLRMDV